MNFDVKPDNYSWSLSLSKTRRLLGRGNPFTDKYFTQFLNNLDDGMVSEKLKYFINKYGIHGNPVLMDANDSGFRFVKGDVGHCIDAIGTQLQKLVDCYCGK